MVSKITVTDARAERQRAGARLVRAAAAVGCVLACAKAPVGAAALQLGRCPAPSPRPQPFARQTETVWMHEPKGDWDFGGPHHNAVQAHEAALFADIDAVQTQLDTLPNVAPSLPQLERISERMQRKGRVECGHEERLRVCDSKDADQSQSQTSNGDAGHGTCTDTLLTPLEARMKALREKLEEAAKEGGDDAKEVETRKAEVLSTEFEKLRDAAEENHTFPPAGWFRPVWRKWVDEPIVRNLRGALSSVLGAGADVPPQEGADSAWRAHVDSPAQQHYKAQVKAPWHAKPDPKLEHWCGSDTAAEEMALWAQLQQFSRKNVPTVEQLDDLRLQLAMLEMQGQPDWTEERVRAWHAGKSDEDLPFAIAKTASTSTSGGDETETASRGESALTRELLNALNTEAISRRGQRGEGRELSELHALKRAAAAHWGKDFSDDEKRGSGRWFDECRKGKHGEHLLRRIFDSQGKAVPATLKKKFASTDSIWGLAERMNEDVEWDKSGSRADRDFARAAEELEQGLRDAFAGAAAAEAATASRTHLDRPCGDRGAGDFGAAKGASVMSVREALRNLGAHEGEEKQLLESLRERDGGLAQVYRKRARETHPDKEVPRLVNEESLPKEVADKKATVAFQGVADAYHCLQRELK